MAAVGAGEAGPAAHERSHLPAIVFVGFMGAGKSRAAEAAAQLGLDLVDTDAEVERELGVPLAEFFAREGESVFREREEEIVTRLLDRAHGAAVAAGGGSVLSPKVREAMARHFVVWLDVDADDAWRRVSASDTARPLAADEGGFRRLFDERRHLYEEVADVALPARRDRVKRALPAILAARSATVPARLLWAESASGGYPVVIGRDVLGGAEWPVPGRRFLVTDTTVAQLHAGEPGDYAAQVEIDPGEARKTLAEAQRVLRELALMGMRRDDHIVAVGGGVVGDLAGFCAAVYQRGVAVAHVPTTLVAQVDSAYGGKTGVDIPEAKNYVGAYHLPAAVVTDPSTLDTLPPEELRAGYAEVVKTALIAGGELWERVRVCEPGAAPPDDVIIGCVRAKLAVVAEDERDQGARATLNLGHTVGHAIEAASGYARYRHGEAVALGLLAALRLSGAGELRDEVAGLLARASLPTTLDPDLDTDAVVETVGRDKKRTADGVGFVLIERPGEPRIGQLVDDAALRHAIEELRA